MPRFLGQYIYIYDIHIWQLQRFKCWIWQTVPSFVAGVNSSKNLAVAKICVSTCAKLALKNTWRKTCSFQFASWRRPDIPTFWSSMSSMSRLLSLLSELNGHFGFSFISNLKVEKSKTRPVCFRKEPPQEWFPTWRTTVVPSCWWSSRYHLTLGQFFLDFLLEKWR